MISESLRRYRKGTKYRQYHAIQQQERNRRFYDTLRHIKAFVGCRVCGNKNPDQLQFHHRDGETKLFAVSRGSSRAHLLVLEEITKCDVLCQDCHISHHTTWRPRKEN